MGVIENELRATARCIEECEIISIKKEFDEVNSSDVFVKGCLNALSYRLRQVEKNYNTYNWSKLWILMFKSQKV